MKDIIYAGFAQLSYLDWHKLTLVPKGTKLRDIFGIRKEAFNQIKTSNYKKMETDGQDYYVRKEEGIKIYASTDARSFYLYSEDKEKAEQNPFYKEFGEWEFIFGYDHNKILAEYKMNKQEPRVSYNDSGFQASVFKRNNQVIIAYRGTNPLSITKDWAKTNADFACGVIPDAVNCAIWLYEKVATDPILRECEIHVTGHSMGGALAQYIAVYGYKATKPTIYITDSQLGRAVKKTVTWNGLGVGIKKKGTGGDIYKKLQLKKFVEFYDEASCNHDRIINYYLEYDTVPDIQDTVGINIRVDRKKSQNPESKRGNHYGNYLVKYHTVANFIPFFNDGNITQMKLNNNFLMNSIKQAINTKNEAKDNIVRPKDYLKNFGIEELKENTGLGNILDSMIDKKESGKSYFYYCITENINKENTSWFSINKGDNVAEIGCFNNMSSVAGVEGGQSLKIEVVKEDEKANKINKENSMGEEKTQENIEERNELKKSKMHIGDTEIGHSACIVETGPNKWEEDLGYIKIKYSYAKNKRDLIVEWERKS